MRTAGLVLVGVVGAFFWVCVGAFLFGFADSAYDRLTEPSAEELRHEVCVMLVQEKGGGARQREAARRAAEADAAYLPLLNSLKHYRDTGYISDRGGRIAFTTCRHEFELAGFDVRGRLEELRP